MGTRHLISVIVNGETKIAQYGQWDGYPAYTGEEIKKFLNMVDHDKFATNASFLEWWTDEDVQAVWKDAGADDSGWVTMDVADRVKKNHPELSRDTGVGILWIVAREKTFRVVDSSDFADDDVWCEYHYALNFDDKTVTMDSFGKHVGVWTFDEWIAKDMEDFNE